MTPEELLTTCHRSGIVLEARGDRLPVEAPAGAVTAALRDELTRCKPALLALLAPVTELVSFKGGLVVPVSAFLLALDLERRGFKMSLDPCQQFQIDPTSALTDADRSAIRRWRLHLGAIIGYDADAQESVQ